MFIINTASGIAQSWAEFLVDNAWVAVLFFILSLVVFTVRYNSVASTRNCTALRTADSNAVHAFIVMVLALIGATPVLAILTTISLLALLVCLVVLVAGALAGLSDVYWRLRRH